MKRCASCGEDKSLEDFHNQSRALDGKQSRCKVCNREQRKAYYRTAHGKSNQQISGKRWEYQVQRRVFEYLLTHPCVDCGECNPIVLDFDHIDPATKEFTVGIKTFSRSWKSIVNEIEKCQVRCANCHRKRTAEQFAWRKLTWYNDHLARLA